MRKQLKPLVLGTLAACTLLTVAQAQDGAPAGQQPDITEPALDPETGQPLPEEYQVVSGDTLWHISERFLKNPWYWPKVWSFNPKIMNPHLIYPGDRIRFVRPAEGLPSQFDVAPAEGAPMNMVMGPDGEMMPAPDALEGAGGEEEYYDDNGALGDDIVIVDVPGEVDVDELVSVSGDVPMVYQVDRSAVVVRRESFVPLGQYQKAAIIVGDPQDRVLYANSDYVYLEFKDPSQARIGENFSIYRSTSSMEHPKSERPLGFLTDTMGNCQIVRVQGSMATAVITAAYDPIERGDFLGPYRESVVSQITPVDADQELEGMIVEAERHNSPVIGENQTVYVDLGEDDGVRRGNQLMVVRGLDQPGPEIRTDIDNDAVPQETIGTLLVIDTNERVSTALVTWSVRELKVGDSVELRVASR